mmetsp:Transcript_7815/g.48450  ORF Transcript_7815/g.48450 Transcript_7815/m.48450 type:complete len:97 (-) Transcript_7815:1994-2284(-)
MQRLRIAGREWMSSAWRMNADQGQDWHDRMCVPGPGCLPLRWLRQSWCRTSVPSGMEVEAFGYQTNKRILHVGRTALPGSLFEGDSRLLQSISETN